MATRIIIRHLGGSKINQVEQFPLDSFPELTIGREPGTTILFDALRDDAVSRKHAVIRIEAGDPPRFKLSDLGSSNGTFLNGERITGEIELLPGDTLELGAGGPKFAFDIEPRPSNLVARTRVISTAGSQATRVIDAAEDMPLAATSSGTEQPVTRSSVGRNTVMRLLSEQRQATSRIGIYALAGVLVVIGIVGGLVYYKTQTDVAEQSAQFTQQAAAQTTTNQELVAKVQQQQKEMGLSPTQIVDKFANATVLLNMQWRLYDRETGKPLFHKTVVVDRELLPAYVAWDGKLYRWLTTEDDSHTNYKVGAGGAGTGFIVNEQGLAITNKHVAAGWLINYNQFSPYERGRGVLFRAQEKFLRPDEFLKNNKAERFDMSSNAAKFRELIDWLPEEGGPVFANTQPVIIGKGAHTFEGRNEELSVRFPGSRVDVNARLVLPSPDADAALIKIDATQSLSWIPVASDDAVKEGERVVVLGYPAFNAENQAVVTTTEAGELRHKLETIPQPTVTEGNISNISLPVQQVGNVTVRGTMGHTYQLTVPSWKGNSGGPVFNGDGMVVGLYTYGSARETVTYAVPIMYARDLMKMQRTTF